MLSEVVVPFVGLVVVAVNVIAPALVQAGTAKILPEALMLPVALKFPPVTLPVAEINPPVNKFPPVTLPVTLAVPAYMLVAEMLTKVMLPIEPSNGLSIVFAMPSVPFKNPIIIPFFSKNLTYIPVDTV